MRTKSLADELTTTFEAASHVLAVAGGRVRRIPKGDLPSGGGGGGGGAAPTWGAGGHLFDSGAAFPFGWVPGAPEEADVNTQFPGYLYARQTGGERFALEPFAPGSGDFEIRMRHLAGPEAGGLNSYALLVASADNSRRVALMLNGGGNPVMRLWRFDGTWHPVGGGEIPMTTGGGPAVVRLRRIGGVFDGGLILDSIPINTPALENFSLDVQRRGFALRTGMRLWVDWFRWSP